MKTLLSVLAVAFMFVALFFVAAEPQAAVAQGLLTAEQLKDLLQTPRYLFFLMLLASFGNMLKQKGDANRNGNTVTLAQYLGHWPETFAVLIANVIAFVALIMTDQLNFASALGVGYGVNSLADLMRPGGRSASLQTVEPKP